MKPTKESLYETQTYFFGGGRGLRVPSKEHLKESLIIILPNYNNSGRLGKLGNNLPVKQIVMM